MSTSRRWLPAFAFAVAGLLVLPALLMKAERGFYQKRFPEFARAWPHDGSFSMLESFTMCEDSYVYAARIRHAATHPLPGDPYIRENRSAALTMADFLTYFSFGL